MLVVSIASIATGAAVSACATTSDGLEFRVEDRSPVVFDWLGSDESSGTLTATLPDGRLYRGSYLIQRDGEIVADLGATNGERMSCRLVLARPSIGMRGGGEGSCRMTGGTKVDATLPPR
jgi:hypothetical protein